MVSLAVEKVGGPCRLGARTLSAIMATPKTTIQIETLRSGRQ